MQRLIYMKSDIKANKGDIEVNIKNLDRASEYYVNKSSSILAIIYEEILVNDDVSKSDSYSGGNA